MNAEQFTYWLQGFVEMNPNAMLTHTQWEIVKDHLKLVMDKQTPQRYVPMISPGVIPPIIKYPDPFRQVADGPLQVTC